MSTIAAGTTSTTALVSTGDTTGKLTFQTNGTTTAMTIDTSQNVGIGTSSPGSLDPDARNLVVGGGSGNTGISIYSGNASSGRLMFADGTSGDGPYVGQIHYDHSSNYMRFITNGGERVRITSAGDVGIGGTPNNYGGQTCLTINNATGYSRVDLNIGGVKKSSIYGEGSSNMIFETAGSERMRIDSSGNVGIGTSSPGAKLAVSDGTVTLVNSPYGAGSTGYIGTSSNHTLALLTNNSERMRIDTNGDVMMGLTSIGTRIRLTLQGSSTSGGDYTFYAQNSAGTLLGFIRNDGVFNTGVATNSPYNLTNGNAANVYVDSGGALYRSTSSLRYKSNVQDATHGLADVLKLRSVTYNAKNSGDTVFGGLIAEEVHEAGLTEFVMYDKDGQPDALHYGNMVALLTKAIQELKAEFDAYKAAHP